MSKQRINLNADEITAIRRRLGAGKREFANLLGLGASGARMVEEWESGCRIPTAARSAEIATLENRISALIANAPFAHNNDTEIFRFIDLFAGVGGIRLPFQELGGKCVFTSEWDKFAQKTYLANYGEIPNGDITGISAKDIPDHDLLLGGFPCQAFSQAGLKKGFSDTRGTMFFEIQRILAEKRPKAFLLENVKQLKGHDKGRTLKTIEAILRGEFRQRIPEDMPLSGEARKALSEKLNYWVDCRVLRAADFGAPQNRERIFIIGFNKDHFREEDISANFKWPVPPRHPTRVGDILDSPSAVAGDNDHYTLSDKLWAGHVKRKEGHKQKGNGFGYSLVTPDSTHTNTLSARYYKDGSEILVDQSHLNKNPRKLTPRECARLQGFPENFIIDAVSRGQIYKQFGNSVCVKVIRAIAGEMVNFMTKHGARLGRE